MNFISNVLDSIPVVGHVKGVIHYAVGDNDGGNKAMYQSTRTSAVLAGGAAGCVAGPAGAALGAMYAGLATDGLASIAMNEPQGLVQSCKSIGEDISDGRNPTGSILSTGFQLGLDGVGGLGMGGLSSAANKVTGKAVENVGKKVFTAVGEEVIEKSVKISAQEIAKMGTKKLSQKAIELSILEAESLLVSAHIGFNASKRTEQDREKHGKEERERKDREEKNRKEKERKEREDKEKRDSPTTNSGSSQPPRGNKNNNGKAKEKTDTDYTFEKFMQLLREVLNRIYKNGTERISKIFEKLTSAQINYLLRTIQDVIRNCGTLDEGVELVIKIFKEYMSNDISFTNFLSLLEFVTTYINNELNIRILISNGTETTLPNERYKDRRARIIREIVNQDNIVQQIVNMFELLKADIETETSTPNNIFPDFRDTFAAVYHFFKHRCVSGRNILDVKEYYGWIRRALQKLKQTPEYKSLTNSTDSVDVIYEISVVAFNRRFKIVVKFHRGKIVLSSAFFRKMYPGDRDGDVFIQIIRKP